MPVLASHDQKVNVALCLNQLDLAHEMVPLVSCAAYIGANSNI